ncbi:MAG TPA: aa3-type cytochrome c oxidase subunit IV [Thermohalobaculum sp.]|nr:aa3-type cytochrome c oxidase subunit IV [Thermohalobaculum sp.]
MGEFKHGSMDTTEQEKTFAGLIKASILVCVVSAVALIFLAIVGTNPT